MKIINAMKDSSISSKADVFLRMMNEDHIYLFSSWSFADICGMLGTDTLSMNKYLFAVLGMGGEELILQFRKDYPEYLRNKYWVDIAIKR